MISNRLKNVFALSVPVFIAHGIEEFLTGFYNLDAWDLAIFAPIANLSTHAAMFLTFQIMLWLLLIVAFLLLLGERWQLRMLAVLGLVYIFEFHHLVKALLVGGYYPGLITALAFPIIAYFFWQEWFRTLKSHKTYA